jgi:hypothetical protein
MKKMWFGLVSHHYSLTNNDDAVPLLESVESFSPSEHPCLLSSSVTAAEDKEDITPSAHLLPVVRDWWNLLWTVKCALQTDCQSLKHNS